VFNITNPLNYENPAAALPAGTIGQPFTDAVAGTFGYMLGPLNRTVGLGTARQTQNRLSVFCSDILATADRCPLSASRIADAASDWRQRAEEFTPL